MHTKRYPLWLFGVGMLLVLLLKPAQKQQTPLQLLPEDAPQVILQVDTGQEIQTMPLEEYLIGVVSAEMPASFEGEALAAQAVAARTYAIRKCLGGGCGEEADVCTDSAHCQAWCSEADLQKKWGTAYETYREKITDAVQQTAGIVLYYDGAVAEALFHSSSSGNTEACAQVFAQDLPYLQSVTSPERCEAKEKRYSLEAFCALVSEAMGDCDLSQKQLAEQLQITGHTPSGRVAALQVGSKTLTGKEARKLFGLRSTDFSVTVTEQEVCFLVQGHGHGVGMSQHGANTMAEAGESWQDILAHYYPGTQLQPLPETLLHKRG